MIVCARLKFAWPNGGAVPGEDGPTAMHIFLAIATVLGLIAYFVVRANQVNKAGRELLETASEVKGFVRRSSWRRKTEADPTRNVEDPWRSES